MAPLKKPATYDDIVKLPENVVGEILEGDLVMSPRPAMPHAVASSAIGGALFGPFQGGRGGPGGWWILDEPELHLGRDVVVPDLAGWRRERMPRVPKTPAFKVAPDWICEVVSPGTARHDRVRKPRIYARHKVSQMWLVDPLARTLEVFRLEKKMWSLVSAYEGSTKVRAEPFDAVTLDLREWWLED